MRHIDAVHPDTIEMGLERTAEVAARLELLPLAMPSIIVAGTNGISPIFLTTVDVTGGIGIDLKNTVFIWLENEWVSSQESSML